MIYVASGNDQGEEAELVSLLAARAELSPEEMVILEIAADIAQIVRETEGTTEISDGMEDSTEELRIIIDRDKAIEHGLTVAQIFQQISAMEEVLTTNSTSSKSAVSSSIFFPISSPVSSLSSKKC